MCKKGPYNVSRLELAYIIYHRPCEPLQSVKREVHAVQLNAVNSSSRRVRLRGLFFNRSYVGGIGTNVMQSCLVPSIACDRTTESRWNMNMDAGCCSDRVNRGDKWRSPPCIDLRGNRGRRVNFPRDVLRRSWRWDSGSSGVECCQLQIFQGAMRLCVTGG